MSADDIQTSLAVGQSDQGCCEDRNETEKGAGRLPAARKRVRVLPAEKLSPKSATGLCNVIDAAAFLVTVAGPLARGKLLDLLYFAQAWHLVWDNELLFPDRILATEAGVEIETVSQLLGDTFTVTATHLRKGRSNRLTDSQQRTLVGITRFYAGRNHFRLSEEIRQSLPWQKAQSSPQPDGARVIEPAALHRHYRQG